MAEVPLVSIIILTCNQLEYTKLCLESIRKHTKLFYELIVVDNGSVDGSKEYLRKRDGLILVENEENRGFAGGCNQGIKLAKGKYILLLNNDTIVGPRWLENLIRAIESRSSIGIVGPKSNYVAGPQQMDIKVRSLGEIEKYMDDFNKSDPGKWFPLIKLIGFCMLIKREVVREIGLFDESYRFGNFEDDDFCLRSRKAGYELLCAGDTFVFHFGSATFRDGRFDFPKIMEENFQRFQDKWQGLDLWKEKMETEMLWRIPCREGMRVLEISKSEGSLGAAIRKRRGDYFHLPYDGNIKGEIAKISADFDMAIVRNALGNWINPSANLCECRKALREGGKILINFSNANYIGVVKKMLTGESLYKEDLRRNWPEKLYTKNEGVLPLINAGFTLCALTGFHDPFPGGEQLYEILREGAIAADGYRGEATIREFIMEGEKPPSETVKG
jgi:GT2 family glycosyltransferase